MGQAILRDDFDFEAVQCAADIGRVVSVGAVTKPHERDQTTPAQLLKFRSRDIQQLAKLRLVKQPELIRCRN